MKTFLLILIVNLSFASFAQVAISWQPAVNIAGATYGQRLIFSEKYTWTKQPVAKVQKQIRLFFNFT